MSGLVALGMARRLFGLQIPRSSHSLNSRASTRLALGMHYLALAERGGDEDSPESLPVYRQRQAWFLAPAFVFLAVSLLLPDRRKP